jgi:hypothetical protein
MDGVHFAITALWFCVFRPNLNLTVIEHADIIILVRLALLFGC